MRISPTPKPKELDKQLREAIQNDVTTKILPRLTESVASVIGKTGWSLQVSAITAGSPCSPPTCFTMGGRRRPSSNVSKFSTTLMLTTPNDSCGLPQTPAAASGGLD